MSPQLTINATIIPKVLHKFLAYMLFSTIQTIIPPELLACTERQLVRTYPAGKRTDSSNYNPIPMWNNGIHMTALNIQTPGIMQYNLFN